MIATRRFTQLLVALGFALTASFALVGRADAGPASAYCAPPYLVEWPAAAPVWSFCWTPPNASDGINGSGLEIYQAFFRGKRVFWKAHLPVLNVQYDPPGCFGTLSYRDWQNSLKAFEANNVISPGYAEPTVPPKTVLDHPGVDAGTFAGVAVEKTLPNRVVLTTQMQAGWYRYIQKWTFYSNGVIWPQLGFTGVTYPCLSMPHTHHAYWRFDFDVDSFANNVVERAPLLGGPWAAIKTETKTKRTGWWRVRNKVSGRGYVIRDGPADGIADAWGVADRWDLRYHFNEQDDGGATGGPNGNAIHIDKYLTGEDVNGQDIVVWYRAGYRHTVALHPQIVGPRIYPFGPW